MMANEMYNELISKQLDLITFYVKQIANINQYKITKKNQQELLFLNKLLLNIVEEMDEIIARVELEKK